MNANKNLFPVSRFSLNSHNQALVTEKESVLNKSMGNMNFLQRRAYDKELSQTALEASLSVNKDKILAIAEIEKVNTNFTKTTIISDIVINNIDYLNVKLKAMHQNLGSLRNSVNETSIEISKEHARSEIKNLNRIKEHLECGEISQDSAELIASIIQTNTRNDIIEAAKSGENLKKSGTVVFDMVIKEVHEIPTSYKIPSK